MGYEERLLAEAPRRFASMFMRLSGVSETVSTLPSRILKMSGMAAVLVPRAPDIVRARPAAITA